MPAAAVTTAARAAAAGAAADTTTTTTTTSILQTINVSLEPPKSDVHWSSWYVESADTFVEFKSYQPAAPANAGAGGIPGSGGSFRTLSARQISGSFEDEVAKNWEEDWEDEDVEDTFDNIMGQIFRIEASAAATGQNNK